jgi:GT2 family glycosyltransferase
VAAGGDAVKLGVPTIVRYDLLGRLLDSAERGSVKPDGYLIVDNGGGLAAAGVRVPENTRIIVPGKNLGVAAAWNLILDAAGDEPVVISNDDLTLGPGAFATLSAEVATHPLVTAGGWLLFAQAPACTQAVGYYDEGFFPAYYEDTDYARRMALCGFPRRDVRVELAHVGSASIKAQPLLRSERSGAYYHAKWGGAPEHERWREPFDGNPPEGWRLRSPTWTLPRKRSIHDYIYGR